MGICDFCGGAGITAVTMPEHYTEDYGIPLLLFNSVVVKTCANCKKGVSTVVQYPDRLIAAAAVGRITHPEKLSGREIRFLRKALGESATKLADFLEVAPETLSRWENDKAPISPQAEKLLRMYTGIHLSHKAPTIDFEAEDVLNMEVKAIRAPNTQLVMCFELVKVKVKGQPLEFGFEQREAA